MKILVILHANFEKSGSIKIWAKNNHHIIVEASPFLGEKLPIIDNYDFLIIMGGPQSPLTLEKTPYLVEEIDFIKQAIVKQKKILGICLGAQLISEALGAKTERSAHREVGIFPLELLGAAISDPFFQSFSEKFDAMHWHNDMPGLPEKATVLAKSKGCARQIIRYSEKVYGFQCHFELDEKLVKGMIENCPEDLEAGIYVKSKKELIEANYSLINAELDRFLGYMDTL